MVCGVDSMLVLLVFFACLRFDDDDLVLMLLEFVDDMVGVEYGGVL